jgi:hypothetical protein
VIAAIVLLMSALGIVARISPGRTGYPVAGAQQPNPTTAVCPASEQGGGVASTPDRSRRRLL